jgi:DNA polymerase
MKCCVVDFETYYASDYSLSRMSTEDYVNDPRFEIILVGLTWSDGTKCWTTGTKAQIGAWLEAQGVFDAFVIAHNGFFDFLILAVHFGKVPKMMCCTLKMAYVFLRPHVISCSLENCLKELGSPVQKGDEVKNMIGRTRQSLSKPEMANYAKYCLDDCDGTMYIFKTLASQFPKEEFQIIDMTLRMWTQPQLLLDAKLLAENLAEVRAKKAQQMAQLPPSITATDLRSNPRFAKLLQSYGIEPPMKISKTTKEETFAFAKTDTGWKDLEEKWGDHPELGPILAARVGAKSTIEESRSARLLDIAKRYKKFRIPLMYYGAHTGRYGGREGINAQNLPRIDKSRMRFAVKAPRGCVVLAADLAQIEARITAWLAGAKDLVEGFRRGEDLYSRFATRVFNVEVPPGKEARNAEDKMRRFVGKTCILGLGFGMGGERLKTTLRKDNLKFTIQQTSAMVQLYRHEYWQIPELWKRFDSAIHVIADGARGQVAIGPVTIGKNTIVLPNGMPLTYPRCFLREVENELGRRQMRWSYRYGTEIRYLWGGTLTENVVQSLARIVVMRNMVAIKKELGLRPALQQHDELDYVLFEEDAEEVSKVIAQIMSTPPEWAPDLPVAVEVAYGKTLGDCK